MNGKPASSFAIWRFFSEMPSTNVRISVSMLGFLATAGRVVVLGWTPSWEWLAFLTLWAGLDIAQFGTKRTTDAGYVAAKAGVPPSEIPPEFKPPEVGA